MLKNIGVGILVLVSLLLFGWAVQGSNFFMYKFFAPKQEQVRREVFEQSKAYRQGMVQELQRMQFEYIKSSPDQQAGLSSIILHKAADVPAETLPSELNSFIAQLRQERLRQNEAPYFQK